MGNRTSKAIALVQKVAKVVVPRSAAATRGAGGSGSSARALIAERALVATLNATTTVARALSHAPFPRATPAQRIVLEAMASQLRAAASAFLPTGEDARDPSTLEGALARAVEEALALVDAALRTDPELARHDEAIEIAALGEGDRRG